MQWDSTKVSLWKTFMTIRLCVKSAWKRDDPSNLKGATECNYLIQWNNLQSDYYTYLQNKRMRRCGVAPPPPIIFERLKLPQQIIYRRKENLSESPNHKKYWENILLSRFYEQFSRNRRNLGHFRKFKKISNSQNTNILYIILKRVIWRFQIYNLLREKKSNFAVLRKHLRISRNTLLLLSSRNLNISRNKLYIWNLQITCFKMIYNMFIFWEFEIFSNFRKWPKFRLFRENCS